MKTLPQQLLLLSRVTVGGVFVLAGIGKLGDFSAEASISSYLHSTLPSIAETIGPLLRALPPFELAIGVLLAWGVLTRIHAVLGGIVLIGYIAVLAIAWVRGIPLAGCNCFGRLFAPSSYTEVILRNSILFLMVLPSAILGGRRFSLDALIASRGDASASPGRSGIRRIAASFLPVPMIVTIALWAAASRAAPESMRQGLITGVVTDEHRRPIADCRILSPAGATLGRTNSEGEFRFTPRERLPQIRIVPPDALDGALAEADVLVPDLSSTNPSSSAKYEFRITLSATPGESDRPSRPR